MGDAHARRLRSALALLAALLLIAGCGDPETADSDTTVPTTGATTVGPDTVACSVGGQPRFPASFLNGPDLSPQELVATPVGAVLDGFFVGGVGTPEGEMYRGADGFSIVTDSLVLGYDGQLPDAYFFVEDDAVSHWGGCNPNQIASDVVAARWQPAGPVDVNAESIPIQVEGDACVTGDRTDVITEVVRVDVDETDAQVTLTAWTRDRSLGIGLCAGVGIALDAVAELSSPLGDRDLIDGGTIPPQTVEIVASDGPPATAPESNDATLGRLDCSLGVVVEERVADSGQDPLDIARTAAPDVVEVEPGEPLWWWGIDDNGRVIVGLALGDSDNADYQVWTCDSPLVEPDDPLQPGCSATSMEMREPDPQGDLPAAVADVRDTLLSLASECDIDALAAIAISDSTEVSFGGDSDPAAFWRDSESRGGAPVAHMVMVLSLAPGTIIADDGTMYYTWPGVFALDDWADVTFEQRQELVDMFGQEAVDEWDQFGYLGYRVGITAEGRWAYFVAGD